jgi:signal transduction histidine kinase
MAVWPPPGNHGSRDDIRQLFDDRPAAAAAVIAVIRPATAAKMAPFALFAYGAYGVFLTHSLLVWESRPVIYGVLGASPGTAGIGLVLVQAVTFLAAGVLLLARSGAPGGAHVRLAVAQLRGTHGQPKTVPPLLLLPVLLLWEELFSTPLWFSTGSGPAIAFGLEISALILAAGVLAVTWRPRAAATAAVAGTVILGLGGLLMALSWLRPQTVFYGMVTFGAALPMDGGGHTGLLAGVQGAALLGFGCVLAPRLATWRADTELARRAQALARRVDRLTRTRSDATEVAVAELRRIERDLHDGAQARLVAVGMSLRGAEKLFGSDPRAALALVAEARETSSRALADLRDLVRGIYPPVLADRGLADAVRALALDTPLPVDVDVDLAGEPTMPVAAAVYFGVAEALTNAVRHAEARTVQVSLRYVTGSLRASVADDGQGGADPSRGTGLGGVERRLATFDGILSVSSPIGGPTIVAIEVPCALSSVKTSSS